jgi:hypothetical protein
VGRGDRQGGASRPRGDGPVRALIPGLSDHFFPVRSAVHENTDRMLEIARGVLLSFQAMTDR